MAEYLSVIVCGVSGQGVTTTARLIARAAVRAGIPVAYRPHGDFEAGGASYVTLRLGDASSAAVGRGECDVLIALEKLECARAVPFLKIGAAVYSSLDEIPPDGEPYPREIFDNLAMLGIEAVACDTAAVCRMAENARAAGTVLLALATEALSLSREDARAAIREELGENEAASAIKAYDIGLSMI